MCFYTAVSVYAPAIALSKATGLDTHMAVVLIYIVCVFYSSQGGMKAVVIADTFQVRLINTLIIQVFFELNILNIRLVSWPFRSSWSSYSVTFTPADSQMFLTQQLNVIESNC